MKKLSIIVIFLLLVGFGASKAQAKTLGQIRNEITSLTGRVKSLSQQALAMFAVQAALPVNTNIASPAESTGVVPSVGTQVKAILNPTVPVLNQNKNEKPNGGDLNSLLYKKGDDYDNQCTREKDGEKLYIMAGAEVENNYANGKILNDVWSTIDGINYTEEVQINPFSPIYNARALYINDTAYLFQAFGKGVYTSKDFKNWKLIGQTPFSADPKFGTNAQLNINNFDFTYFKGKFWATGSLNIFGPIPIWSSTDAKTWKKEVKNALWNGNGGNVRGGPRFYVFNDRLWVISEQIMSQYAKDTEMRTWSSGDGINWQHESTPNELTLGSNGERGSTNPFVFNDKVWIVSGSLVDNNVKRQNTNDVYSSSDGKKWDLVNSSAPFNKNNSFSLFKSRENAINIGFEDKLITLGGTSTKDAWYSDNKTNPYGKDWQQISGSYSKLFNRGGHSAVVTPNYIPRATDLKITTSGYKRSIIYSKSSIGSKYYTTVGTWKLKAMPQRSVTSYKGTFQGVTNITHLYITGSEFKDTTGKKRSSLEYMKNITVYVDGKPSGEMMDDSGIVRDSNNAKLFKGPFFDSSGNAIPQVLKMISGIVLKDGESAELAITADISGLPLGNHTVSLSGFLFGQDSGDPCVSGDYTNSGDPYSLERSGIYPGLTLIINDTVGSGGGQKSGGKKYD